MTLDRGRRVEASRAGTRGHRAGESSSPAADLSQGSDLVTLVAKLLVPRLVLVDFAPPPAGRTAGSPIGSSDAPARVFDDQRGEDRVIKHIIAADRPMNRCQVHLHSGGTVPPVPLHFAPLDRSDAVAEAGWTGFAPDVLSVGPRCALPVGPRSVCSAHDRCRSRRGPSRNSGCVCVLIGSPRSSAACPRERVTALSQRFMAAPARKDIRQITRSQDRRRCDDRSARLNSADPVTHLFSDVAARPIRAIKSLPLAGRIGQGRWSRMSRSFACELTRAPDDAIGRKRSLDFGASLPP